MNSFYKIEVIDGEGKHINWIDKSFECVDDASDYINKNMPEYESYAVKRGGDGDENTSEMNGIFWVKDIYEAVDTDTFWLSQTPDRESRFTYTDENGEKKEAGCNRICSYAILKNRNSERLIAFLNTHLDNSSEEAVSFGAKLIVEKIAEIKAQYKDIDIILTGDFNSTSDSDAYKNNNICA